MAHSNLQRIDCEVNLRMLASMVSTTNVEGTIGSHKLNREVFGIPVKGVQMFTIGGNSSILPFSRTGGSSLSLLENLVQLVTKRLAKAIPTSAPAIVSSFVPLPPAPDDDDAETSDEENDMDEA